MIFLNYLERHVKLTLLFWGATESRGQIIPRIGRFCRGKFATLKHVRQLLPDFFLYVYTHTEHITVDNPQKGTKKSQILQFTNPCFRTTLTSKPSIHQYRGLLHTTNQENNTTTKLLGAEVLLGEKVVLLRKILRSGTKQISRGGILSNFKLTKMSSFVSLANLWWAKSL